MDLAESFLQDKGFNGFSYAHIAAELGVKNAAIHYHFPSKEELICAVIQRYRDRFQLWINNSRIKNLPHQEKLDWFFSISTDARADNGKICTGSLETNSPLPPSCDGTGPRVRCLPGFKRPCLREGRQVYSTLVVSLRAKQL
jgi:TetR/AcrR family transcriptional repressor of nem operon